MKRRQRRLGRLISAIVCMSAILCAMALGVSAADVSVFVHGSRFCEDKTDIVDSVTCIPFRAFVSAMTCSEAEVSWDEESGTARAEWNGMTITARVGDSYIIANGRYLWCGTPNYIENDRMMTAIRPMAKAFCASVTWNEERRHVVVTGGSEPITPADEFYDEQDLYWLSRIISAESRGEPLLGKLAVGTVIYNRVVSEKHPDTVYDVIFDMKHGVQFSPARSGSVYRDPTEESIIAAKLCMDGYRCEGDVMYFCTTAIMKTSWAGRNRPYVMTIGGHAFFA